MKQKVRRWIAILCALCMLLGSMPVSAYAESTETAAARPTPATPTDLDPVPEETDEPAESPGEDAGETEKQ